MSTTTVFMRTRYSFKRVVTRANSAEVFTDIRSIEPLTTFLIICQSDGTAKRTTIDYNTNTQLGAQRLEAILRQEDILIVSHDLKWEFFCMWQLGLNLVSLKTFDTKLTACCLWLGQNRTVKPPKNRDMRWDEMRKHHELSSRQRIKWEERLRLNNLKREFCDHPTNLENYRKRIKIGLRPDERLAMEVDALREVYNILSEDKDVKDMSSYLVNVEFPYAEVNASMEWNGIRINRDRENLLRSESRATLKDLKEALVDYGIENPNSDFEVRDAFDRLELHHHFEKSRSRESGYPTSVLKQNSHVHRAINLLYQYRRISKVYAPWKGPQLLGVDGRLHATFIQSETSTGRSKAVSPAVMNFDKIAKALVEAEEGSLLAEPDCRGCDVMVAARFFNDEKLLALCMEVEDIYAHISERILFGDLTRTQIKNLFLPMINGSTTWGSAKSLGITYDEADQYRQMIIDEFPKLFEGIKEYIAQSRELGKAPILLGLSRTIDMTDKTQNEIDRQIQNAPIQGCAAIIFKLALVMIYQRTKEIGGKLIMGKHDSVLLEAEPVILNELLNFSLHAFSEVSNSLLPGLYLKVRLSQKSKTLDLNQELDAYISVIRNIRTNLAGQSA